MPDYIFGRHTFSTLAGAVAVWTIACTDNWTAAVLSVVYPQFRHGHRAAGMAAVRSVNAEDCS